jgi:hypothetical protein
VLPDERHTVTVVDRHHTDRIPARMDHAVDPRLGVGSQHLIVKYLDPVVLVRERARDSGPRAEYVLGRDHDGSPVIVLARATTVSTAAR